MQNLYTISTSKEASEEKLTKAEIFSVRYHDLFDYPLSFSEMIRWRAGDFVESSLDGVQISIKNGYSYLGGKEGIVFKRMLRKRVSAKKMEFASNAAKILSFIPGIKMVAVTGSLAMENCSDESDIDLMIVSRQGSLWTTRLLVYWVIGLFGIQRRKPFGLNQKDALCLNMWLDESDLTWPKKDRNVYTAHEIAQIKPLVNKDATYEKFLTKNRWVLDFWPNSVKIPQLKNKIVDGRSGNGKYTLSLLEKVCFWGQYQHMKPKITREVVTLTRALFHPQDWGKVVIARLTS